LVALEHETESALRAEAAEALCEAAASAPKDGKADFVPDVVRLVGDSQEGVRCAGLALATEVLSPNDAKEILVRHLNDRGTRIRIEAAGRLADLALPEARGALAAALDDEVFSVRFEAARGMVALHHSAGLETLLAALDEPDLRFRAAAALAHLGNKEALPKLKKAFHQWFLPAFDKTQLAGAMASLGDLEGVDHLTRRASKGWSVDRAMAIELLGEVKAPHAKDTLLAILAKKEDACRGAAARGLGRLGDHSAFEYLEKVLDESSVSDDVILDVAEGMLRLDSQRSSARLAHVTLADEASRAELISMVAEFG
jgi:HEAT repeat protein